MSAENITLVEEKQKGCFRKFVERNAGPIFGIGLVTIGTGSMATVRIISDNHDTQTIAAVQGALPATGFQGTVERLSGNAIDEAYVDLEVDDSCTLPGVIVNYTQGQDGTRITNFTLAEYRADGPGSYRDFTNPAGLATALALNNQTCAQATAVLTAQNAYMGVR
jgi:hypothetical protein